MNSPEMQGMVERTIRLRGPLGHIYAPIDQLSLPGRTCPTCPTGPKDPYRAGRAPELADEGGASGQVRGGWVD